MVENFEHDVIIELRDEFITLQIKPLRLKLFIKDSKKMLFLLNKK